MSSPFPKLLHMISFNRVTSSAPNMNYIDVEAEETAKKADEMNTVQFAENQIHKRDTTTTQVFVDIACGVIVCFLQFIFAMSYAAGCFSSPRTYALFGIGTMMTAIAAIVTQMCYCWLSKIPYLYVSPDAFYVPLINSLIYRLSTLIVDDEIFHRTLIFAVILSTISVGIAKFIAGKFKLVQVTDYIPYPAICGLMAGIGINLIQIGIQLATKNEWQYALNIIPSLAFASFSILSHYYHYNQALTFMILVVVSLFFLYSFKFIQNWTMLQLEEHNLTFSRSYEPSTLWVFWINESQSMYKIDFGAIAQCYTYFLSMSILMVLKISLTIPAYEKVLKRRFNKSTELVKYGIGTIVAGIFGGTGTSPSISILSIVVEMGGSEYRPGFVAPLVFLLLYFSKFSCITLAPKFIFSGMLLASGYHMVMTWLVLPIYRIPRGESAILFSIILVYLSHGMLIAMGIGSMLSLFLFSFKFHQNGCVQFVSNSVVFHSTAERSDHDERILRRHRHRIRILQLQGYIAFANANQLYDIITQILNDDSPAPITEEDEAIKNPPAGRGVDSDIDRQASSASDIDDGPSPRIDQTIYGFMHGDDLPNKAALLRIASKFKQKVTTSRLQRAIAANENPDTTAEYISLSQQLEEAKTSSSQKPGLGLGQGEMLSESSGLMRDSLRLATAHTAAAPTSYRSTEGNTNSGSSSRCNSNKMYRKWSTASLPSTTASPPTADPPAGTSTAINTTDSHSHSNNVPYAIVIHMNNVLGLDASAMDILSQISLETKAKKCRLVLASVDERESSLLTCAGLFQHRHVTTAQNLDDALCVLEVALLKRYKANDSSLEDLSGKSCSSNIHSGRNSSKDQQVMGSGKKIRINVPIPETPVNTLEMSRKGFESCLSALKSHYEEVDIAPLLALFPYMAMVEFAPGQTITAQKLGKKERLMKTSQMTLSSVCVSVSTESPPAPLGYFFLEKGFVQVLGNIEVSSNNGIGRTEFPHNISFESEKCDASRRHRHSNSYGSYPCLSLLGVGDGGLSGMFQPSDKVSGRESCLSTLELKHDPGKRSGRDAKHGPGWMFEESGPASHVTYIADTHCRLHYLSGLEIREACQQLPQSVLALYQLQNLLLQHQLSHSKEHIAQLLDVLHFNQKRK